MAGENLFWAFSKGWPTSVALESPETIVASQKRPHRIAPYPDWALSAWQPHSWRQTGSCRNLKSNSETGWRAMQLPRNLQHEVVKLSAFPLRPAWS